MTLRIEHHREVLHSDYETRLRHAINRLKEDLKSNWGFETIPFEVEQFMQTATDIINAAVTALTAQAAEITAQAGEIPDPAALANLAAVPAVAAILSPPAPVTPPVTPGA